MKSAKHLPVVLFILGAICAGCSQESQQSAGQPEEPPAAEPATLLLTNAYVYTVDNSRSVADAVAIRGNEIIHVGSGDDVGRFIGSNTRVYDLGGRMLMPGLHDMHIHATGVVEPDMCDFKGAAKSLEQMVPFLQGCIEDYRIAEGDWLVVLQWPFSSGNQPGEGLKTIRAALDAASDKHPIIMWGDDGHHAAVNSLALAQTRDKDGNVVGINRETIETVFADFREMIAVDESGEPSGVLSEGVRLIVRPDFTKDLLGLYSPAEDMMPAVAKKLAASGITSIQDPYTVPELLEYYTWLERSGLMTFRMRTAFFRHPDDAHNAADPALIPAHVEQFKDQREKLKNSKLIQPNGVKLFADAVLEGNPYATPPTLPVAAVLGGFEQPVFSLDTGTGTVEISGYVDLDRMCSGIDFVRNRESNRMLRLWAY